MVVPILEKSPKGDKLNYDWVNRVVRWKCGTVIWDKLCKWNQTKV